MYIHEGQCTWYEKNEHSSLDNYNSFTKLSIVNRIYNFFYFLNKNNTIELRKLQTQCSLIKQKNHRKTNDLHSATCQTYVKGKVDIT